MLSFGNQPDFDLSLSSLDEFSRKYKNRESKPSLAYLVRENDAAWSEKLSVIRFALITGNSCNEVEHPHTLCLAGKYIQHVIFYVQ